MFKKNKKIFFALLLTYIALFLIIFDKNNILHTIKLLSISIFTSLVIAMLLFIFKEKYNESKKVRFYTGALLLLIYFIMGLIFTGLIFHAYFCLTIVFSLLISNFFLDLEKE